MRISLAFLFVLAACGTPERAPNATTSNAAAPPPASQSPATTTPKKRAPLAETPADRLGTAKPGQGLEVGNKAPDVTLVDITGHNQSLAGLWAKGPLFVIFYRGGWCPFCNVQLHELTQAKADFARRGVGLVAISVDKPESEAKTQAEHGVPFPMLSDPKLVAHQAFKVVHAAGAEEQEKLTKYGIDLAAASGESHKSFAIPSVFLVDATGIIRFAHVDEDYKTRPSPRQLLEVADRELVHR